MLIVSQRLSCSPSSIEGVNGGAWRGRRYSLSPTFCFCCAAVKGALFFWSCLDGSGGVGLAAAEAAGAGAAAGARGRESDRAFWQGLTLVHFSAQRQHLLRETLGSFSGSVTKNGSG